MLLSRVNFEIYENSFISPQYGVRIRVRIHIDRIITFRNNVTVVNSETISALNQPYTTKLETRGNSTMLKTETEILNECRNNNNNNNMRFVSLVRRCYELFS